MINQISLTNTFFHILQTVSALISNTNLFTDGPTLTCNTELRLIKPGITLNVQSSAIVAGNITSSQSINAANISITGIGTAFTTSNATITNINVSNSYTITNVSTGSINSQRGTINLDGSVVISTANLQSLSTISSLIANTGTMNASTVNVSTLTLSSGNVTLNTFNSPNINVVSTTIGLTTNTAIDHSIIANAVMQSCIFTGTSGWTASEVGLANVDNTSDATKNSAIANLTNKTLMSPLIMGGITSGDPTSNVGIATKQYTDSYTEQINGIINGAMDIWQRGNTYVSPVSGGYTTVDRFGLALFLGSALFTIRQSNNVPTVANAGIVFNYSLEIDVTTSQSSVGSPEHLQIHYGMEGYDWKYFAQQTFTLSFWVQATKTGTYCVRFSNSNTDRTYIAEYTVNVSDTWEFKTITVPASPSAGTWNYTNGAGLFIEWVLALGGNFGTAGVWQTGVVVGTANQVNMLDSTSNFFRLTGVRMERGTFATPLQPRPFEEELQRCQRYFCKSFHYNQAPVANTGIDTISSMHRGQTTVAGTGQYRNSYARFPVPMRSIPNMTFYNPGAGNNQARDLTISADLSGTTNGYTDECGFVIYATGNASSAIGDEIGVNWTAEKEL